MVPDTTIQVEKFMEDIAGTRGHHKSVKGNIMEVRCHLLATLIITPTISHSFHLFFFPNVPVLKMPLNPLIECGPKRKLVTVSSMDTLVLCVDEDC